MCAWLTTHTCSRNERLAQIEKLERDIKKINAKRSGEVDSDEERKRKKAKQKSALDEEFAKYEKSRGLKGKRDGKGRKTRDEGDVLAKMDAFRGKLRSTLFDDDADEDGGHEEPEAGAAEEGARGEEVGLEVDDDTGFLAHKLHFPKDNDEEVAKAERDYEVIDPRQRGARAREEERQRKKQMRPKDGGRGARR
jgi:peptidyl-prolyl cis-trans isomerase SDCCAG10